MTPCPPRLSPAAFLPPPVAALGDEARIHLKAMRFWVMLARSGRAARPAIEALMGPAAGAFGMLMDRVVAAWPEPFTTYPPCATAVSPDEDCLLTLVAQATTGTRAGFDAGVSDMLDGMARARLWEAATRLGLERAGLG